MHSAPPERALWRELLDLALGKAKTLSAPDGRSVSASVAWAVGAAVYFRANSRGVVEGFSHGMLAADCRIDPRTARSALKLLAFLRIVAFKAGPRRQQRGPRPRALHMNLGGLDWPAVRRRAKLELTKQADLLSENSGHHARQLDGNSGHHARQQRAIPERATNLAAGAGAGEGEEGPVPDHRTEQQQQRGAELKNDGTKLANARVEREHQRIEGLIAAIAARSRRLDRRFDETACRQALAAGELNVDQLQTRANELQAELLSAESKQQAGRSGSARNRRGRYNRPDLTDKEQRIYEASGGDPWAVQRYREDKAD